MIIRWLGAFGSGPNLKEALEWELKDNSHKCAERIFRGKDPEITYPIVGLLVKSTAIVRRWSGDVWSVRRRSGQMTLRATRKEDESSSHNEYWVRPRYSGVVIKSRTLADRPISQNALRIIKEFSMQHKLPVYRLSKNGRLKEVILREK